MIPQEIIINKLQKYATHTKRDKYGKPIKLEYSYETLTLNINNTRITFNDITHITIHYNKHTITLKIHVQTEEYTNTTKINLQEEKTYKFQVIQ